MDDKSSSLKIFSFARRNLSRPLKYESSNKVAKAIHLIKIWGFHELARYDHYFVKDFSKLSTPITKLTHKGVKFVWNDEYEASFQKLKECLTSALVLALLFVAEDYIVYCDASRVGLGCILM